MDMNQIKRQSSFSESLNMETKKLRRITDEKNKLITSIENLSNELFYEIFDYLDGCHIYQAFSNLNFRIQQLITSSSLSLKIGFFDFSEPPMKDLCRHVIIPNRDRIMSLIFWNSFIIDEFFKQCIIDSSFNRLESICLYGTSPEKVMVLLFYLNSLSRLFSLKIVFGDEVLCDLSEIYRMIFYLPSLKYNDLSIMEENEINVLMPFAINERFSTIKYLAMKHDCELNELISVLYHTPRLHHLICGKLLGSDDNVGSEVLLTLPNLIHIRIYECSVEFDEFEKFLKKICGQLQVLRIDKFLNRNFIYPDRWEQLILENIPQLLQFRLDHYLHIDGIFKDFNFEKYITYGTSRFWIDRGWIFELLIDSKEIYAEVRQYQKSWFNFHENVEMSNYSNQNTCHDLIQHTTCSSRKNINHSSIQFPPNMELSIGLCFNADWNLSFIDKLYPMLRVIQFNSLVISCDKIPICEFLKLIRFLPNLNSLGISSWSLHQLNNLSDEDAENLRLVSKNNKIRKVRQSMDIKITEFLIDLCPQIEHFEVTWIIETDLERIVRFILMKTLTHILHLHSLQFCVRNGRDEIVNDLKTMIDSEKLLSKYIIKRSGNNIALQWKLL